MNLKDFKFAINKGQMTMTRYLGNEKIVVIPDEFEGEPVTVIGKEAFGQGRIAKDVEELVLPKHLEIIQRSSCLNMKKLKKVNLPNTLREIHSFAFCHCLSLEEIVLPASLTTVKADAFDLCSSLKKVVAVSETTKVSPKAFGKGDFLEEIDFSLLKCLEIPIQARLLSEKILNFSTILEQEQEEIKSHLKKKVNLRKELFLGGNVQAVSFLLELKLKLTLELLDECLESSISNENAELTAIFLDYKNKNFAKNVQEDFNTNKELVEIGLELPTLKQFKAKWKCSKVEGGLSISEYKGSETHETIPAQLADGTKIVEYRGKNAGKSFPVLLGEITHLTIDAPLTALGEESFYGRQNLVSLILPDTIETIGEFIFCDCQNLKNFEIPPKIKSISASAFKNCRALTEITIPETVEVIESDAFESCVKLKKVNFLGKLPVIKESAFNNCKSLIDDDGFVIIGSTLFDYYGYSKKIIIPDGITKISSHAARYKKFQEVIFPDSLEYIGEYAFSNCHNLTTLSIGNGVKIIKNYAFQDCPNLNHFEMSKNLEELGYAAFYGANKFKDEQGFQIIGGTLTNYDGDEFEIVIPEGVKTIGIHAFSNKNIKKVTFPSTLEVIKINAFYSCEKLKEIVFSDNLKEIGDRAFIKCIKLKNIQFPDGVKLGKELFDYE